MKLKNLNRAIVAIAMLLTGILPSMAYDFEVDGIYYQIINGTNEVCVTSYTGNKTVDSSYLYSGDIIIPANVIYEGEEYKVSNIGAYAFKKCVELTSIKMPDSITTIGVGVFMGCFGLLSIELPDSLTHIGAYAFENCVELTSIKIPDSVVEIGQSAFAGCIRLININLGNGVEIIRKSAFETNSFPSGVLTITSSVDTIENYAFRYCKYDVCNILCETPPTIQESSFSNLKTIIVPLGSKELYQNAKYWSDAETIIENGSVEIEINNAVAGELMKSIVDQYRKTPATVTKLVVSGTINDTDIMNINSNMTSLLYLDISNTDCTQLPSEAFKGKSTLMTILLPEQLETIGDKSFYGCKSLCNEIICPESVTSIGKNAFEGCSSLKSVILPPQLESIEQRLFLGCTNITNIDLSKCSLLTEIGTDAFYNTVELRKLDLSNCKSLTTLNYGAFRNCGIEELDLSMCNASVIDSEMFFNCRNLKNILLPKSIKEIKKDAFSMCDALENVDFSNCELLENIGCGAFSYCSALKNLELSECINLTAIDGSAFSSCTSIETINFPDSLLSIGFGAFIDCSALKSINFPDSNLTIEGYAFSGATSLIHMSLPSSTPPTTGDNPFESVDNLNCVISVPTDSFYDYLSAQYWGSFISIEDKEEIKISVEETDSEGNDITDTDNSKGGCEIKYDKNHDKNKHGLPMKSATRSSDSNSEQFFAITSSGSSIFAAENNYISFQIIPDEGYEIDKLMFNDVDVTSELIDNVFTTPATSAGYINSFKISLVKTTDSVNNIELSDNYDIKIVGNNIVAPDNATVYNLNGIKVNTQNLSSGIYIVVIENKPFKVIIK